MPANPKSSAKREPKVPLLCPHCQGPLPSEYKMKKILNGVVKMSPSAVGVKAGHARAAKLSPERRLEISRIAVRARQAKRAERKAAEAKAA